MGLGLTVDMNANLARFEEQMNRMAGNLDNFQRRSEGMSEGVNKALGALGVGLSVAGIGAFIKNGIDAADAMNDMADRTGIAVENLAGLQLAAKTADTDIDSIAKSINKLSIFIAKNGEEMKQLGVDAKQPYEAFLQFADVFAAIEDPQRRAALGAAVLGKSYSEMAPLLLQGGAAIREQVDAGQKMTGITTENAKAAADLNDKIDTLNMRFTSLTSHVVGPIIPGLSNIAERFDYAAKKAQGFSDVFTEGFWERVIAGSDPAMAISGIKKLDGLIHAQEGVIDRIKKYPKLASLQNYDIGEEQRKLDILIERRGNTVKKLSMQNDTPGKPITPKRVNNGAIDDILGGDGNKGDKDKESAVERLAKKYDDLVASMQREVALRGDNSEAAKMEYEIINGSFSGLAEGQKLKLLNLAAEKDGIEINKKAYEEYDQVIADGIELSKKQRADMANDYDRLNKKFNGPLLDLNAGIADAMDARAQGLIPDDTKLKVILDKMGRDYNRLTSDAEDSTGQMSEFAVQAAHNMQSAFADFLFDPFQDGIEGMGANFVKIIQRMVAEAASAQIFNVLLGKNYGSDNATGGLLSAGIAGLSSIFGGMFDAGGVSVAAGNSEAFSSTMNSSNFWAGVHHDGGIVGRSNRGMSVDPAVFNSAHRYHSGGIPGLKPNEVPIIALDDEEVLTRSDPRHRYNLQNRSSGSGVGTGDISITTQVNVSGASGGDNTNMQALGAVINSRIKQVIAEEKRPGGLLA